MKYISCEPYLLALLVLNMTACNGGDDFSRPPGGGGGPPSQLSSVDPAANETAAPVNSNITAVFNEMMNGADSSTFVVNGSVSGKLSGTYAGAGTSVLSFDPDNDFAPGEEVDVTLTTGLTTTGGASLDTPFAYRFRAAVTDTGSNATFFAEDSVPAGDGPSSLVTGDLDGDGDLDLAVTNKVTFDLTVLLNDGSAIFSEASGSPVSVGSQPVSIVAGDWDGDGDLDLAVANSSTDNVTVLLNDGEAGFRETGRPAKVGDSPASVTAGDWDGDGDLDLAVASFFVDNITILVNG